MRADRTPKPVLTAMGELSRFIKEFKYGTLPERLCDATVIITNNIDSWAVAYGSFILAKQAGLDVDLVHWRDTLPDSPVYMLPSLHGDSSIPRSLYIELEKRVREGAVLYISVDNALLSPFTALTGLRVNTRHKRLSADTVTIGEDKLIFDSSFKLNFDTVGARVIFSLDDGTPAVTEHKLGRGRVIFVSAPIEERIATLPGVVSGEDALPYYKIYKALGLRSREKCAVCDSAYVGITEHKISETERILCILNHRPENEYVNINLQNGYTFIESYDIHGTTRVTKTENGFSFELEKNTGIAVLVKND